MRFTGAAILQLVAVYLLIEALRRAGVSFGDSVDIVLLPVVLANGAGALIWSWSGPKVAPVVRRRHS
jgi:hypothetical protein